MEYMGDAQWWNERFKGRVLNIMNHEACLQEDMKYFPKTGKILDVACGDGRNAIYLARLGYSVHAIDFSEAALTRLNYFAKEENLNITTKLVDLSTDDILVDLGKYDAIIINHYRLKPELYKGLMNHINEDGILWVNGFREVPIGHPNITASDILLEDDFISLEDYKIGNKKLYEIDQQKFMRCMWRGCYV